MRPPVSTGFTSQAHIGHRPRQHSQGFFEPSLPHASSTGLNASQIAAAAAMLHLQSPQHERKRSVPGLAPINTQPPPGRRIPSPVASPPAVSASSAAFSQSNFGDGRRTAATAAVAAFPRSPLHSPLPPGMSQPHHPAQPQPQPAQQSLPEAKTK